MSEAYKNSETCIKKTIKAFNNDDYLTAAAAAYVYNIASQCLQWCVNELSFKFTQQVFNKALTLE